MPASNCISVFVILCVATLGLSTYSLAEEPLHARIDNMIAAKSGGPVNPPATDADFMRRIYLDLAGRIPTIDETREFLAETAADKRAKLIDKLFANEDYPRRMQELFNVMLMERRGDHEEWTKFLQSSFEENKPWDQIVREILNPNADDEATRGAAFFYTKRLEKYGQNPTDYPGLVRDVGRLFMGVDVQCAQCHNHLFIDDYKQVDYQGLFAFVGNAFIRRDVQFPAIGQNPLKKKIEFMSVFDMKPLETGPRLPFGDQVDVPVFKPGEEFLTPPDKKTRAPGVLKFSTLKILAEQLPTAENDAFTRNIVNRLWWMMMGRGIVHPLDLRHSDNPPSHPELLDLLAEKFGAHKFDIKWLLRELALTETYGRSSLLPESADKEPTPQSYRVALERPLGTEQILRSVLVATGELDHVMSPTEKKKEGADESAAGSFADVQKKFVAAIANPPREPEVEFSPSVKAALFLSNDSTVLSWLESRDGNLIDRLAKIEEAGKLAEELYLTVLTRRPTEEEQAETVDYLTKHSQRRAAAIGNLAWALIASTEFCVNH